jgi:AcrR family transcriptional regulator
MQKPQRKPERISAQPGGSVQGVSLTADTTLAEANTATRLVQAALLEFNEHGFNGTDTNKIARRAGFAPQSFYRWFDNKLQIFLAAYRAWEAEELVAVSAKRGDKRSISLIAKTIVAHHRAYVVFRRSLRTLAYEVDEVRVARAQSRERQVAQLREWLGARAANATDMKLNLLKIERLSDAIAEGELSDLGVSEAKGIAELSVLIKALAHRRSIGNRTRSIG